MNTPLAFHPPGGHESKPGFSGRLTLDVLRLKRETKTLESVDDYTEMAQLALQESQAAEAKAILDEGFTRGVLGKGAEAERQKRLLALAAQRASDAPKALQEAVGGTDGTADLGRLWARVP
jgi:hypothetical protein